jgi:Fe-S-cluster-containing hydrogenase component 2
MHSIYREAGAVSVNRDTCTQCGVCARVCPTETLTAEEGNIHIHTDSRLGCIACGHCMMVCPEGAVTVTGRGLSPDDVTPSPDPATKAGADALEALMLSRRSVRQFSEREVDPALLERIVRMAATAPMGIPPWDVGCTIVRGRGEVQRLASEVVKGYDGFLKMFKPWLLAVMRPFVARAKYDMFAHFVRPLAESYVQGWREGRDTVFHGAPALLIFHHSRYADASDAAIACTYATLAAESLGLGSTMIGGAPPILQRNKTLCQSLGIPAPNAPSICLILGYPAIRFQRAIRRRFLGAPGQP